MLFDTPKEELLDTMENEQLVIGRYPRVYGKTTAMVGFAIHQVLFHKKRILYSSVNAVRRIRFLRNVSWSYRNLPTWMRKHHQEGPDRFTIEDGGSIFPASMEEQNYRGVRFDHIIFDDIEDQRPNFVDIVKVNNAKLTVVGTFRPDHLILGKIWSDARVMRNGWVSLPSMNEEWKVETLLSLCDPQYSKGY